MTEQCLIPAGGVLSGNASLARTPVQQAQSLKAYFRGLFLHAQKVRSKVLY